MRKEDWKKRGTKSMRFKKIFLFFIAFTILLSGCSLKLKTKEIENDKYISVGNELSLFGFGIGESIHTIRNVVKSKEENEGNLYTYSDKNLSVFVNHNISQFIVTSNPRFEIMENIKIGMTKEELLDEYSDLELFEHKKEAEEALSVLFKINKQKVILEFKENKIDKIIVGNEEIPFQQMVNYTKVYDDAGEIISDDEFIASSRYLTLTIDYKENWRRLLSGNFLEYARLGLIEGIPVPIGMNMNELTNRFGAPEYVFEGQGPVKIYYFYKKFNVYMGFNEEGVLIELKLPTSVSIQSFKQNNNIGQDQELNELEIGEKYTILFREHNNRILEVVISNKGEGNE